MTRAALSRHDAQLVLPVYSAFVFFDWFGTVSHSRFWDDITGRPRHPLARPLRSAVEELFVNERDLVRMWMLGQATDDQVVARLDVSLPSNYRSDFLVRSLLRGCKNSDVDPTMAALVSETGEYAFTAIASDNMDCFVRATPAVLSGETRVDEVIVSSQVGAMKKDDPESFFGPTLRRYALDRSQAILIDDCLDTCHNFEAWGGRSIHFESPSQAVDALRRLAQK